MATKAKPAKAKKPATKPSASTAGLAEVAAAVAAKDGGAALDAALAWWRTTRAPAVADLVEAISTQISPPAVADDRAFGAMASRKQPRDLGALLPVVPTLPVSFLPAAADLLVEFPDDPRLSFAIGAWAIAPPTTSSSTYPFWSRLLAWVATSRDPRARTRFGKRLAKQPDAPSQFWPKFYRALEKAVARLEVDPPADVDAPTRAAIDKLAIGTLTPVEASTASVQVIAPSPVQLSGPLLAQATKHLAAGRVVAAIDAMLERWRETRVPALADLIDRASTLLPTYDLPLGTVKTSHEAWMGALAHPSATMPQLLVNLTVGPAKLWERRLIELANLPDDPRIAARLTELCGLFGASPQRTQYWRSILELLARIADVRMAAPLAATFGDFEGDYYDHHRQANRIIGPYARAPESARTAWRTYDVADAKLAAALAAAIDRAIADDPARTLVAAIVEDEAARMVYADWLTERGHPRGELIVLAAKGGDRRATKKGATKKGEQARIRELQDIPRIWGALDLVARGLDVTTGIPRTLLFQWSHNTISTQRVTEHPLVVLLEAIVLEGPSRPGPTPGDLATLMLAATSLQTFETSQRMDEAFLGALAPLVAEAFVRTDPTKAIFTRRGKR